MIYEVRQCFSSVVDLHHPSQMHVMKICGLQYIRGLDHPLASAGWNRHLPAQPNKSPPAAETCCVW